MIRRLQRFDLLVAMGCLVLLSYFGWHAWKGPRGYSYLAALEVKADALAQDLTGDEAKRGQLEAKVALMRPERVDPDMLDERARYQLDYVHPRDLVRMIGQN